MDTPSDRRYHPAHTWAHPEDGGIVTVGITDFAQEQLGDVVYLELPKIGSPVKRGAAFGVVESAKTASELIAPVTGEIVDVNVALEDTPDAINSSPYEAGWIIRVRMADALELSELLNATEYDTQKA